MYGRLGSAIHWNRLRSHGRYRDSEWIGGCAWNRGGSRSSGSSNPIGHISECQARDGRQHQQRREAEPHPRQVPFEQLILLPLQLDQLLQLFVHDYQIGEGRGILPFLATNASQEGL